MPNTVHNERIKYAAAMLNSAANTVLGIGIVAPIVALFLQREIDYRQAWICGLVWFIVLATLHIRGKYLLGGLRDD